MLPAAANPVSGSLSPKGQTSLTLDQWLGATSPGTDREKGSPPKRHEGGGVGGGGLHHLIAKDDSTYHRYNFCGKRQLNEAI